jgi:maltose alpha-D-glucosyltransferase/alpha-amylase
MGGALFDPPRTGIFDKTRIHGDYHLGQTLKTAEGFALIDFEGEPARTLEMRRRKTCVLKDVAGMLRSFDYAIETAAAGDDGRARRLRDLVDLRTPFLDAYAATSRDLGARTIPDRAGTSAWLARFELEKALYELDYEINNRPGWVGIPLRGILTALEGAR